MGALMAILVVALLTVIIYALMGHNELGPIALRIIVIMFIVGACSNSKIDNNEPAKKEKEIKIETKEAGEISNEQYKELQHLLLTCPTTRKSIVQYMTIGIPNDKYDQIKEDCNKESIVENRRKLFFEAISKE